MKQDPPELAFVLLLRQREGNPGNKVLTGGSDMKRQILGLLDVR
jgi:hypothetical protein